MIRKLVFLLVTLILLASVVSAASQTITIKGQPRTPDNKIDYAYDAGVSGEQGKITSEVNIDNDNGMFEIKDYTFDDSDAIHVFVTGSCFNHMFQIKWEEKKFKVYDAYAPQAEKKVLLVSEGPVIDLGIIKEDKSNQIMVDSDDSITFLAYDMDSKEIAYNGAFKTFTGMSDSFKSSSRYKIVMKSEGGKTWEKEVTTGKYCESTRIIKRGNYMLEEHFPGNSFPPITFFRKISLWLKGLFS